MKNSKEPNKGLQTVGQRLKQWRSSRRIKGYQLAESIRISPGSLSEIENGKSLPSAETITNLMTLEGMDIFWLLMGEGRNKKESEIPEFKKKNHNRILNELIENQENGIAISRQLEYNFHHLIKILGPEK